MKKVKFYPFLNNKPDRNGLYHVFLRCHKKDEKRKVLPTEIRITKSSWNANAKFKAADGFRNFIKDFRSSDELNRRLENTISQLSEAQDRLIANTDFQPTIIGVIAEYSRPNEPCFLKFIENEIENSRIKKSKSKNSLDREESTLKKLNKYVYLKLKWDSLPFSSVTVDFWNDYSTNIYTGYKIGEFEQKANSGTTLRKEYSNIKAAFNKAASKYKIDFNPFNIIEPPKLDKTNTAMAMSRHDFNNLIAKEYQHGTPIWKAQKSFIARFLMGGMRISDFITLKWENIREDHLVYVTAKSKKKIKLPLAPELKEVLNEFKGLFNSEYIFGALRGKETADEVIVREKTITKNQNKYLKRIAKDLSIEIKRGYTFSTHSARSTLLTLASEFEDIEYLMRMAAHSSSKTTEGYISVDVAPEEEERTLNLYKNILPEPSSKMKIAN